jgi:glycosyltransferase involved in cell wall biosynthesis
MPTVQAIIPAYNPVGEELAAAVQSCLACPLITGVVVVDDGSEPPMCLRADPRVRVLRQANSGPSSARNRGLDGCSADFAMLLDQDDVLEPGGPEAALVLAERLGAVAVVAARYEQRGTERRLKEVPAAWRDGILPTAGQVFRPVAIFGGSGLLIRSSAARAVRFDPDLRIGEDREFLRRVADVGPIAVCSTPMLTVRLHEHRANLSSRHHLARRVADLIKIIGRHCDPESDAPLREQTLWLLNALAKQHPVDREVWSQLAACARERGWPIPLKSRLRAWRGGLLRA